MLPTETRQGAICRDHHRTELCGELWAESDHALCLQGQTVRVSRASTDG